MIMALLCVFVSFAFILVRCVCWVKGEVCPAIPPALGYLLPSNQQGSDAQVTTYHKYCRAFCRLATLVRRMAHYPLHFHSCCCCLRSWCLWQRSVYMRCSVKGRVSSSRRHCITAMPHQSAASANCNNLQTRYNLSLMARSEWLGRILLPHSCPRLQTYPTTRRQVSQHPVGATVCSIWSKV
jgi:hypothetical protein